MTFSLVLVDDWELRGDGSGDMRRIQFDPMRQLTRIYEDCGLRGSFNVEVMQQLHHIEHGARHPHLEALAQEWEQVVLDTYRRGHDIQLHVHSQWSRAAYQDNRWKLSGDWSIINHPRGEMERMIGTCKAYLEGLMRRVDPNYRCVSFRSGAWAIAPSEHALSVLAQNDFVLDMSIVKGVKYEKPVQLDYTRCEEGFLPYYPDMKDARRVAGGTSPIVSVPTFSFIPSRASVVRKDVSRISTKLAKVMKRGGGPRGASGAVSADSYAVWHVPTSLAGRLSSRLMPTSVIADLSALSFPMMKDMLQAIRCEARSRDIADIPIILENHTKDITDFSAIARFANYVSRQSDFEVITLKELAGRLAQGRYPIAQREAAESAA